MSDRATAIIAQWEQENADRGTPLNVWQQIANYHLPNRADYITRREPGAKRMNYIYDASPVWCVDQAACGLHSLLYSNALQWFYLHADDERVNADDEVRAWLEAAAAWMYGIFNSPRQNFASQSYEMLLDQVSIGNSTMAVLEHPRAGILFSTRHMRECVWIENDEDRIDGNIRQWDWTAKQAVQAWDDRAPPKVKEAYASDKGGGKSFKFLHSVQPRKVRDPGRADARNMAWESVYVSVEDKAEISVSGFTEFPYICSRLAKISGEKYGRGWGHIALPDTQMLNEFKKIILKNAQLVVGPPMEAPDDGYLMNIKTVPNSINYYRSSLPPTARIAKLDVGGDVRLGIEMLNALQAQIARTFNVDMFRMPVDPEDPASEGKGSTATYWLQRRDKEMMMISPMLSRQQAEASGPLIDRVFAIGWRRSKARRFGPGSPFPPPPAALSGVPLRVEYVSPIALAQKSTQMDGVTRLMQLQAQLKQMDPGSGIILDGEAILRIAGRDFNAPAAVLKSAETLQQEAQAKAEAEQAMANHAALANVASAAKDGSAAIKNVADVTGDGANANDQQAAA